MSKLLAVTLFALLSLPTWAHPTSFPDFLRELRATEDLDQRRQRIMEELPYVLDPLNRNPDLTFFERLVPEIFDLQEMMFLFLIENREAFSNIAADQDYAPFEPGYFKERIQNYTDDEPAARALRILIYVYDYPFQSSWIKSRLAPLSAALVNQTLGQRFIAMNSANFHLKRFFEQLDIWTNFRYMYSQKKLEFRVDEDSRRMVPLMTYVRFKKGLLDRCAAWLP